MLEEVSRRCHNAKQIQTQIKDKSSAKVLNKREISTSLDWTNKTGSKENQTSQRLHKMHVHKYVPSSLVPKKVNIQNCSREYQSLDKE
jgi:hypothetical protein